MAAFSSRPGGSPPPLDQLTLLYGVVDQIQRARRVEQIYEEAVEGVRGVLGVDRSAILVRGPDGGMAVKTCGGLSPLAKEGLRAFVPWSGPEREARAVIVGPDEHGSLPRPVGAMLEAEHIRHAAWIPLLHRARLIGELFLGRVTDRPLDPSELRLAETIAGHLAYAIWRVRSDEDQAELLRRFEAERSVLDSVIKQMPAGVLLADVPGGRIVSSNPQVSAIWGKTLRHASQVSDYAMWDGLTRDGEPLDPEAWPLARSVLHGEVVKDEEIMIERGDGTRGIVRMSSSPVVDGRGRQLAAVATVFDVTAERREEARQEFLKEMTELLNSSIELERTLDSIARSVVRFFADWCVLYRTVADGAVERVAAAHRRPEKAESVRPFSRGALPRDSEHPVMRVVREQRPLLVRELGPGQRFALEDSDEAVRQAAEQLAPSSVIILPLLARGRALGAVALMRSGGRYGAEDLTLATEVARRAATAIENALLYEEARTANRAKSRFLAVMSHEFRTPLSAILGYADILTAGIHGDLTETQGKHVERIKASVRHLSHLVDEILSFSSMEAGKERVARRPVELNALVTDVIDIMEPMAEAGGLALRVQLPPEPVVGRGDMSKLRQILINLLGNAIKYTPEGEVSVRVRSDGEQARCEVADTGPGIAPDHQERVFEPFWQVERPEGGRITGTGLGLAVARRLARLMGGDILLESEPGAGSCFTLVLPLDSR